MGASLSRCFNTPEDADRWAEQQVKLAARWNLQKIADLGNTPVVRVPLVAPDGATDELTLPLEPGSLDRRLQSHLLKYSQYAGYREDRSRQREQAYVRSLRFD
jgi:hypothetical protein